MSRIKSILGLILFVTTFSLPSAASIRTTKKIGITSTIAQCLNGCINISGNYNLNEKIRLILGRNFFLSSNDSDYNKFELAAKWFLNENNFTPYLGISSFIELSAGIEYTTRNGLNMGFGGQLGRCAGFLGYVGMYF